MTKKPAKKHMSLLVKITLGVIGALLFLAGAFVFIVLYEGSTTKILKIADQFKPDSSWELVSERIEPPRLLCIDVSCPSISRTWKTNEPITRENLEHQLKISNLSLTIQEADCTPQYNPYGGVPYCSAEGIINDMRVRIYASASLHNKNDNRILLSIQ